MSTYSTAKRVLVGRPLESSAARHQRLSKKVGLAIFSSDAVASSAFATQEILHILVPALGMAAVGYLGPISLLVVALLAIVVFSYRQTIAAYPNGGGSYIVSRENLGARTGVVPSSSRSPSHPLPRMASCSSTDIGEVPARRTRAR